MRYFELNDSISQERCAREDREKKNCQLHNYVTKGSKDFGKSVEHLRQRLVSNNPNLHSSDGYGVSPLHVIDKDSCLRLRKESGIRGPDKQQLYTRVFTAVPDFGRGSFIPNVESRLRQGHDTFVDRPCYSLTERDYDRFAIFDDCMQNYIDGYSNSLNVYAENNGLFGVRSRDLKQCQKR